MATVAGFAVVSAVLAMGAADAHGAFSLDCSVKVEVAVGGEILSRRGRYDARALK